jgi:hypothetical protein
MSEIRLPRIAPENYEAIRSLLKNGIPASYAEWLDLRANWIKEYAGDSVIHVDVRPDQFFRYLDRTRHTHDLKTLIDFVADIDAE